MRRPILERPGRQRQRGAVLYVALVLLILLALIGVTGMQVASLQERMTGAYLAANRAFQNAESLARQQENDILHALGPGSGSFNADQERCDPSFDPAAWSEAIDIAALREVRTRRIDQCSPGGGGLGQGVRPLSENTDLTYQISAFAADVQPSDATNPPTASARVVVDTVYLP
ncbi:pilus assembly PilX family protein [Coralloluteibacterium thermophilus]|uniref:PilX N-terminal domain-containing pilus assembly protein n=1 Tax=Coralloluteibacterium thermophilum TaxID=2707049 RepID=A0ABV9NHR0_9GAMM